MGHNKNLKILINHILIQLTSTEICNSINPEYKITMMQIQLWFHQ
jgi:hypothetical protein